MKQEERERYASRLKIDYCYLASGDIPEHKAVEMIIEAMDFQHKETLKIINDKLEKVIEEIQDSKKY